MTPHDPDPTLDRTIDRTLCALARAEPTPDFASRLQIFLQPRLEVKAAARTARPRVPLLLSWALPPSFGLALVVVAALVASALLLGHRRVLRRASTEADRTAAAPLRTGLVKPDAASVGGAAAAVPVASGRAVAHLAPALLPPMPPVSHSAGSSPAQVPTLLASDLDSQALADLHAPSYPAPPLPPTAQERLVRRMLRRGDERELAQLEPAAVSRAIAQEQASFHEFFEPPPDPEAATQPRSLAEARLSTTTQPPQHGTLQGEIHP